ncbi:MAG: class I SAM-dependent methyltransferase [Planctomycetota bacterium]|nr:MAG: class I SAM-dependent methyltransferase [Planctomycetota bacterium]
MQTAQFQLHAQIEEQHWWFVARRQILRDVIQAVLPPSPETTIVDVGCGTGANLAGLAGDYKCVGVDTSADAIRLARRRFPNVQFVRGFAPQAVEEVLRRARLVMLCDVLEHVPDDFSLFSELLAATEPGTYFLVTVPANLSLWSEHDESFGHYRRYDALRLAQVWEDLPARALFVSHFNSRLYPLVKAVRSWNQLRGTAAGRAGTDFEMPPSRVNRALARCFAGERRRLVRLARQELAAPYRRGVSLMALLERAPGPVHTRHKPSHVAPDVFNPALAAAQS